MNQYYFSQLEAATPTVKIEEFKDEYILTTTPEYSIWSNKSRLLVVKDKKDSTIILASHPLTTSIQLPFLML